ncbi:sigma-70 family RNA polymerase sigma factor [Rhodohalobacter sp. 614A]|uniref:sigma-70 family RNA polymerase sigma factor n=1 Tax=Rhodohalobacter sp. 614A TaxID=2908649 RepID=UPI001F3797CC|nr:sigma-70 family RNA polymerase sigma factor [Rhodohalobacter sp. 614A]
MNSTGDITGWLNQIQEGSESAFNKLFPLVYDRLKLLAQRQMKGQSPDHTFSKTDLVHEVYLKLTSQETMSLNDRAHFYAVASQAMRHVLIDHARKKGAQKRGGKKNEVTYIDEIISTEHQTEEELILIDDALGELEKFDDRLAKIVVYRYFGDMKINDIAKVLNLSARTIKRDWVTARGWLYQRLKKQYLPVN